MDNNTNDLSFEDLVSMSNFDFDSDTTQPEVEITLNAETEETTPTAEVIEPPVLETTPKEEVPPTEITLEETPSIYSELAKEKLASGEWEDVLVGEEGSEVKLSELKNVDKETYEAVLETFKKEKEEALKAKYVEVDGLTDIQKALINIIKTGDLEKARELFENPQQLQEPFQGYDSDNDVHNEQVLSWYYKSLGHSDSEIAALVGAAKTDLSLDTKAQKIVEFQKNQFHENIKKQEEQVKAEKLVEEQKIKEYRKSLMTDLKEEGLSDTMAKKFADVATKYDSEGNLEIDTILDEMLSDPKKAKDLIFFALDKEGYLKKATNEVKKDVQKEILKKVNIVRDTTKVATSKEEDKAPSNPFEGLTFD